MWWLGSAVMLSSTTVRALEVVACEGEVLLGMSRLARSGSLEDRIDCVDRTVFGWFGDRIGYPRGLLMHSKHAVRVHRAMAHALPSDQPHSCASLQSPKGGSVGRGIYPFAVCGPMCATLGSSLKKVMRVSGPHA